MELRPALDSKLFFDALGFLAAVYVYDSIGTCSCNFNSDRRFPKLQAKKVFRVFQHSAFERDFDRLDVRFSSHFGREMLHGEPFDRLHVVRRRKIHSYDLRKSGSEGNESFCIQ